MELAEIGLRLERLQVSVEQAVQALTSQNVYTAGANEVFARMREEFMDMRGTIERYGRIVERWSQEVAELKSSIGHAKHFFDFHCPGKNLEGVLPRLEKLYAYLDRLTPEPKSGG